MQGVEFRLLGVGIGVLKGIISAYFRSLEGCRFASAILIVRRRSPC